MWKFWKSVIEPKNWKTAKSFVFTVTVNLLAPIVPFTIVMYICQSSFYGVNPGGIPGPDPTLNLGFPQIAGCPESLRLK